MAQILEHKEWSRLVRDRDFGPIWGASGLQGFFGEGYLIHSILRILTGFMFFTFRGVTFVAKTTTLKYNEGNMPLKADRITPQEFLPRCVAGNFWSRAVVNVVGLSGPGAEFLLSRDSWHERTEPFMISFMSVAKTPEERLAELREFVRMLSLKITATRSLLITTLAIQWNLSCPNVGLSCDELIQEAEEGLKILSGVGVIPVIMKFNALVPAEVLARLDKHPRCDGFCLCNSIPLVSMPLALLQKYFGTAESPVADAVSPRNPNAGGLSGTDYNRALACHLIYDARKAGVTKHINGCGGIRHWRHVDEYYWAGASSVSLGSGISPLAFWRARSVIKRAWHLFPK